MAAHWRQREAKGTEDNGQGPGKVVQLLVRIALGDPKVVRGCLIPGWPAAP
jgi:hypothetical protein